MSYADVNYFEICKTVIQDGEMQYNERTGKACMTYLGDSKKYDLRKGFPLLTTKKIATNQLVSELIGFLRGVDNAKDFRELGCTLWDANANVSPDWLNNPNRKGEDDLGRIYGVQARGWRGPNGEKTDQLRNAIDKIKNRVDDRRLIVTHWNPGEIAEMALPPCHMMYQFGIVGDRLDMCFYQRSCDLPLGVPFNIASYALLLHIVARITGLQPGVLTHFMWNIHIYEDQLETLITKQLSKDRDPMQYDAPTLVISDRLQTLEDFETLASVQDFTFENYNHYPFIKFEFSA